MKLQIGFIISFILGACIVWNLPNSLAQEKNFTNGESLYQRHCAACHHPERIGAAGSPLLPSFLQRKSDKKLTKIIAQGLPATQMPGFSYLTTDEIQEIVQFLRSDQKVEWSNKEIESSFIANQKKSTVSLPPSRKNLTTVVERGKSQVWIMEKDQVLDKFDFRGVHGGIKYSPDGSCFFVPSRDGWVAKYDLLAGKYVGKIRSSVYLRNIAVDREGKNLLVASWLPYQISVFSVKDLALQKVIPLSGKISALYELTQKDQAIFTFKNRPQVGILDTKSFTIEYLPLQEPMDDFFLDPLERFLIGTCRETKQLQVFSLDSKEIVFQHPLDSFPHLFAAATWHNNGKFYFATPHIRKPYISLWSLYDWKFIQKIEVGGSGFFVRTTPATPYLWVDNGTDQMILVDKKDYSLRKLQPLPGKKIMHTEFSGDGEIAYVSVFEKDGALLLYDSATLQQRKSLPASYPVGKYNFMHKGRQFVKPRLGDDVFRSKCWGCHHPTEKAFGPSFQWIAQNRSESWIRAQIIDPTKVAQHLGYKDNAMPKLEISPEELEMVLSFILTATD